MRPLKRKSTHAPRPNPIQRASKADGSRRRVQFHPRLGRVRVLRCSAGGGGLSPVGGVSRAPPTFRQTRTPNQLRLLELGPRHNPPCNPTHSTTHPTVRSVHTGSDSIDPRRRRQLAAGGCFGRRLSPPSFDRSTGGYPKVRRGKRNWRARTPPPSGCIGPPPPTPHTRRATPIVDLALAPGWPAGPDSALSIRTNHAHTCHRQASEQAISRAHLPCSSRHGGRVGAGGGRAGPQLLGEPLHAGDVVAQAQQGGEG